MAPADIAAMLVQVACFIGHATYQLFQALREGRLHTHPLFAANSAAGSGGAPSAAGAAGAAGGISLPASYNAGSSSAEGPYVKFMGQGEQGSARV